MIEKFYTKSATVSRLTWFTDDEGDYSEETEQEGTVKLHLQQASAELVNNLANVFTISHIAWCSTTADVLAGDTLMIDGEKYGLRAIQNNSFVGANKHLELYLEKYTAEAEEVGS